MTKDWIRDYVDVGDFEGLFVEELGWNRPSRGGRSITVSVDEGVFVLTEAATYRGVAIWSCRALPSGQAQRAVDKALSKESAERVIIFHDDGRQVWRWPQARDAAGAGSPRLVSHEHTVGRPNEALRQRLHFVRIDLEEDPTVLEVVRRLRRAFDSDRVTKSFYSRFAQQHRDLTSSLKGIRVSDEEAKPELRWYASILLNRLMFIYFMQRKGFLDGDVDYLRNRLERIRRLEKPGSFYEFYKDFLIPLFHEGLGADESTRQIGDPAISELLGDIPYVNGGIFSVHPLEAANDIHVPDEAFETVFDFFDQWQWHLDDRPSGNPNEINPDVLGYIFEQFVNNREEAAKGDSSAATNADKGAYYTKEDVTGYMTANTLVPVFLERLLKTANVNPWRLLALDPDRYIWTSAKHGCEIPLPSEIEKADVFPRPEWDSMPVPPELGLPGESWWELVDRRFNIARLRAAAKAGDMSSLADAISSNIDLETLAVDLIDALDTPSDVAAAWDVLTGLRVLDPTCGSGAFLFAALNILQRLYSATFEAALLHARTAKLEALVTVVEAAEQHPNRDYFLLKHAALHNLYGVDLMPEAVEIARLRLFLKLIAQVERRVDIEPLPDLEFNIRPGNALVGALSGDDIRSRVDLLNLEKVDAIEESAAEVGQAYREFSSAQEAGNFTTMNAAKSRLAEVSGKAREQLDLWWCASDRPGEALDEYRARAHPFHWLIEFPDAMSSGGFDVVVGNPPYVSPTKVDYAYPGFRTGDCPDIYAPCLERASQVTALSGRLAMVVPMNLAWGGEFEPARAVLKDRFGSIWASTYDLIPGKLFEGVATRNTIVLASGEQTGLHTTSLNKWVSEFRPHLMSTLRYADHKDMPSPWPKIGHIGLKSFACARRGALARSSVKRSKHRLGHKKIGGYWLSVFTTDPPAMDARRRPIPQKVVADMFFSSDEDLLAALALCASRAMFLWWVFTADGFNVKTRTFLDFPIALEDLSPDDRVTLREVGTALKDRLAEPGEHYLWTPYAGEWYCNFDLNRCRDITDRADDVILRHLGLSAAREEFEIEYRNYMKAGGERPGTVRGAEPDRDR